MVARGGPAEASILVQMPPVDVRAKVISNVRLSSDYNVLTLAAPEVGARTEPGQFVMLKPEGCTDSILRRPFSVFEIVREQGRVTAITILNKRAGRTTRTLNTLEPGHYVDCLGPLGKPFDIVPNREAWLVAGGVGLAPFATLAEALAARGLPTTLFYGARTGQELFCLDLFERLGVRPILATEDGSQGFKGRVTGALGDALEGRAPDSVAIYACGPEPMLAVVSKLAEAHRQPAQVSVERVMGCGLGGCYSCVIRVKHGTKSHFVRSCIGGPVFSGADIVWD